MSTQILVTAVGEDRPGIVSRITEVLLRHGGNVQESRMAMLGGEFAAIILVVCPHNRIDEMHKDLAALEKDGISVGTKLTKPIATDRYKDHTSYEIYLRGADHEGIVHTLSSYLKDKLINIHSVHTEVVSAPETGTPLFCMSTTILVPPSLALDKLKKELNDLADKLAVDIDLEASPATAQDQISGKPAIVGRMHR